MATSFHFQSLQGPVWNKSQFIGQTNLNSSTEKSSHTFPRSTFKNVTTAKFNLYEIIGGRGICNGEVGLEQELKKSVAKEAAPPVPTISPEEEEEEEEEEKQEVLNMSEDAFEKELLGLTGGFPGGEKGLKKFIEENPVKKKESSASFGFDQSL